MSTENTTNTANETSTSPTSAADLTQSLTAETPSSTVDNVQTGDFASWLDGKFNSFEKGQEVAPWDKKEEPTSEEDSKEAQTETKTETEEVEEESDIEESSGEVDSEDTKTMTGSAGAKFKQLKTELKSYKSKVAEMEKMLADKETQSGNSEESSQQLETLKAKLDEYEREIAVSRIEASPQFKEAVMGPTQVILDSAISLAEKYEVVPRKLVDALREESMGDASDSLTEMAADFSERDRIRLYRMADDLAEVSRRRDFLKQNAAKAMAEMTEKQQAYEVEAEKKYREESLKVANTTWSETFENNPVIQSLGEEIVKELRSSANESDLLDTAPEERAYAVYAGVALPHLVKKYTEISNKLAETEKALGKYKKATPKVSGNVDTSSQKQEIGGFLDAVEKRFALG